MSKKLDPLFEIKQTEIDVAYHQKQMEYYQEKLKKLKEIHAHKSKEKNKAKET